MSSNTLIGIWAQGVWENLGKPDCLNLLTISGYALQPSTLGALNSRIGACYKPTGATGNGTLDFDITPDITADELALIGAAYEVTYYGYLARAMLGTSVGNLPAVQLREGDSSITLANPVNIGREYREATKDAQERLNYLIGVYNQGLSTAREVSYFNPPVRINHLGAPNIGV